MRKALITGSEGQDGTYLRKYLTGQGYQVIGISRRSSVDLLDSERVMELLRETAPQEVYHLAAFHHSSQDKPTDELEVLERSYKTHVWAAANLLEGIRKHCPAARFFYAASCHLYGAPPTAVQNETTPFNPDGLYGITKLAGLHLCRHYRRTHGVFASVGILFNHESPLRRSSFVSKKIVEAAVAISRGLQDQLVLGDLETEIDWGYAGDYVVAMQSCLQLPEPGDFVISSGKKQRVRDFVEEAFKLVGLDWRKHVGVDPSLLRNQHKTSLFGDHTKLTSLTGWRPVTDFHDLVKMMVTAELENHAHK